MPERVALCQRVPPPPPPGGGGENILVMVKPFVVKYLVPEEEEIDWVIKYLCSNLSKGPSGMRAEHLRIWLAEAIETETPDAINFLKLLNLIQREFRGGLIIEEATQHAVILTPKEGDDFMGIGLLDVLYKTVAVILNRQLGASITLHDDLHVLQAGRRMGTSSLKAKILQHMANMR